MPLFFCIFMYMENIFVFIIGMMGVTHQDKFLPIYNEINRLYKTYGEGVLSNGETVITLSKSICDDDDISVKTFMELAEKYERECCNI